MAIRSIKSAIGKALVLALLGTSVSLAQDYAGQNGAPPQQYYGGATEYTVPSPRPVASSYYQEPSAQDPGTRAPSTDQFPSSGEVPFQVGPTTPTIGDSQTTFSGNTPVQDLSDLTPGKFSNTKYKWYGFVRLDGIYDFNPIRTTDMFVTSSIPIPQGEGQNFVLTPRYTRIGFDTETPLDSMDWEIKTRIEMDFFNGNTSGAFGSFPLRLRFAWVDFGPFLVGQAASLFMDYDVFPNVLDYEGPPGMVLVRQPIAAIRLPVGESFQVSGGIEQPYSDIQWLEGGVWNVNPGTGIITTAGASRNVQDMPDFTGNVRGKWDYGHFQVAGIARKLTFQNSAGPTSDVLGYGGNLTGTYHPWAHLLGCPMCAEKSPIEKCRFMGQYAQGEGINRYIQDVNGLGLDATFDPINGFVPVEAKGWFGAYEHWWASNWASVVTYGEADTTLTPGMPGDTYTHAKYATANLIWFPVERMGVGFEYLYGTRTNNDGQEGEAHRLQMAFQYRF